MSKQNQSRIRIASQSDDIQPRQDPEPEGISLSSRYSPLVRDQIAPFFDEDFYLGRYPDVQQTGMDPLEHYFRYGWKESRDPRSDFQTDSYLNQFPELLARGICPLLHLAAGLDRTESQPVTVRHTPVGAPEAAHSVTLSIPTPEVLRQVRPHFDEAFYLDEYPEVADLGIDPLVHYMTLGWIEGKDPSLDFSTAFYLRNNEDIRTSGQNPFLHYHRNGKHERWRDGRAASRADAAALAAFEPGGALYAQLQEALELEPMIGFPNTTGRPVRTPARRHARIVDVAERLRRDFAGQTYAQVVLVPHVRMSGATRIGGMLTRALAEIHGAENVLLVQTDASYFEYPEWFPDSVRHLDLSTRMDGLDTDARYKILGDLLYGVETRHVFNVQSRLFWNLLQHFGRPISQEIDVTSYLFCWDVTKAGLRTGYPIQWLRETVDFHHSILTDSAYLAEDIRTRFGFSGADALRVQPLLSYTDLLPEPAPRSGRDRPRAMWAGRHDRQKRLDILVDIARSNPQVDFWVYGKPILDEKTLQDFDPPSNIRDMGAFSSFEDTLKTGFDFFLYTAEWDGIPTALIEAAAARLPIVAPDVGGISELVNNTTGWLVEDFRDVAGYGRAIRGLVSDPDAAQARAGRLYEKLKEKFNPETYRADLQKALRRHV